MDQVGGCTDLSGCSSRDLVRRKAYDEQTNAFLKLKITASAIPVDYLPHILLVRNMPTPIWARPAHRTGRRGRGGHGDTDLAHARQIDPNAGSGER